MDLSTVYAGLRLITAPTEEPLTVVEVESYLRIDSSPAADADVARLILMARQRCEAALRRALLLQTWQLSLKDWPGRSRQGVDSDAAYDHIALPGAAPLGSVTSVIYKDTSATPITMPQGNVAGGYNVDSNFEPGRIVLPFAQIWPTTILLPGAPIQIRYVCGFADFDALKAGFEGFGATLDAMMIQISYAFENKLPPTEFSKMDAGLEYVIEQKLGPYRIYE